MRAAHARRCQHNATSRRSAATRAGREIDPAPATTIAWRLWHLSVDCFDDYARRLSGDGRDLDPDATWTLVGKSEWDVVGGTALVRAAGGLVCLRDGSVPAFNQERPVYPNYVAAGQAVGRAAVDGWLV